MQGLGGRPSADRDKRPGTPYGSRRWRRRNLPFHPARVVRSIDGQSPHWTELPHMARFSRAISLQFLSLGLAVLGTVIAGFRWAPPMPARAGPGLAVSVSGNHLIDGSGQVVALHGVNRPSTVYACIQGWGIFDGPSDDASVLAIASWKTNAV